MASSPRDFVPPPTTEQSSSDFLGRGFPLELKIPPPPSKEAASDRWWEAPRAKKTAWMATALGTLITMVAAGHQLWPVMRGAFFPAHGLAEVDRGEVRSWVRDAARDGVTTAEERAMLEELVSVHRLRQDEVSAFVEEVEEPIEQSADLVRQGAALVERGEFSNARDRFLLSASLDPDNVQAWVNLGASSLELAFLDEAETALRRALELEPERWTAHYNLGASLAGKGREELAFRHLERSLDLAGASGISEGEKRSVRRDLAENRWLKPLHKQPRFEALMRHEALEFRGL